VSTPAPVVWYRRISVQLAVLVAVAIWIYDFGSPWIYQSASRLVRAQPEVEVMPHEMFAHDLLVGADEEADGSLIPSSEGRRWLDEQLQLSDTNFVWLDINDRVVCCSKALPWKEGEDWPYPVGPEFHIEVPDGGELPIGHGVSQAIDVEGQLAGTLVTLCREIRDMHPTEPDGDFPLAYATLPTPVYVSELGLDRLIADLNASDRFTGHFVSAAVATLFALMLGFLISRMFTRRLANLAAEASVPIGAGAALPGPFEEGRDDEVGTLARTMNAMRGRVQELVEGLALRDQRRREWVAQVSHDLRTPLTALMACIDRAEMRLDEADQDALRAELRELLSVARLDADRVHILADDLLDIARLDASDDLNLEPVPPAELVRKTLKSLGPLAQGHQVELVSDLAPGLPLLTADGHRLTRAVENLLRNAIHYAESRVELSVRPEAGVLHFEVRDDGIGLPVNGDGKVDIGELRGRRGRDDSAGLGLTVSQRVAEAHGGEIGAYNLDSGGAAVWFSVPLVQGK
jgi:signal transduction histidine kinase